MEAILLSLMMEQLWWYEWGFRVQHGITLEMENFAETKEITYTKQKQFRWSNSATYR